VVSPHRSPVGGEHRDRNFPQRCQQALHAKQKLIADEPVGPGLQSIQAVEMIAFSVGELKDTRQGRHHLTGRRGRPAFFELDDVINREASQLSKFLTTQTN